jgi:membrane-associated phospholipid phosphatase
VIYHRGRNERRSAALFSSIGLVLAFSSSFSSKAAGCEQAAPWSRLGTSARNALAPLPLALVSGAMATPWMLAQSGSDHALRLLAQRELGGKPNLEPVSVWTPFVLPVFLVTLDLGAYALDVCSVIRPTSAMLQAMSVTIAVVVGLKWTTGRTWPNAGRDPAAPDRLSRPEFAQQFHWFDWKNGSAWPSGHTATMVAAATALTTATHGRHWLGYATIAAATGVAAGMWLGDHHWASDILSGALIGAAFGHSVGLSFREGSAIPSGETAMLLPWISPTQQGVQLAGTF